MASCLFYVRAKSEFLSEEAIDALLADASFLAPYGSEEALKVARALDAKVEALLAKVAA